MSLRDPRISGGGEIGRQVQLGGATGSSGAPAGNVVAEVRPAGAFLSQEELTLSAVSQSLPSIPATAVQCIIQIHGGTVTERAWISIDGSAAVAGEDFILRNVEDTDGDAAIGITTDLTDIRLLGTANASIATIWYLT